MKTSNYARSGKLPNAICISVGVPRFLPQIKRYFALAPERAWLHATPERYDAMMAAKLDQLVAQRVKEYLTAMVNDGDVAGPVEPILLCYESPNVKCHRRMVAEWFEKHLGEEVTELGFERSQVLAYKDMPLKALDGKVSVPAPVVPAPFNQQPLGLFDEKTGLRKELPQEEKSEDPEKRITGDQQSLL